MTITEEDIKNIKHDLELIRDTKSSGNYTSYKIDQAIEYIDQLESENKKLKAFKKRFKIIERLDLPKDTDYVIMTKVDYERNCEEE